VKLTATVYLFPFTWWQHGFDTTQTHTHRQTDRQLVILLLLTQIAELKITPIFHRVFYSD